MSKFDNYGFPALEVAGSITPTDQEVAYSGCYLTCELRGVDWVFRAFPFAD